MLIRKLVQLKKIYKFYFDHFLLKRTVLVLSIKNGFYKIKKSIIRPNYSRYEKMLSSKIVHLKKIYKLGFDHFLVKCTVLVLSIKNGFYKIKKSIIRPNYSRYEKMLKSKIVYFKKIYKFYFYHFFVKRLKILLKIKISIF